GNVARVGFLTNYARLQPMPGGGGMLCWRDSGVNWKQYTKVMLERIQVYIKPGSQHAVDPSDLKMLIDYFHADLAKAIQPEAQIVTAPGPGVLRVRIGLTNLVPTNTMASLAGTPVPYGFVAEIGSGAATEGRWDRHPTSARRAWKSSFAMARRGKSSPNAQTRKSG